MSILLHVLFVVAATYLIVEHFQKKHINFHATAPPSQHTDVEHKIEMAKKNNVESAPPDLKRIVTTAVSPITLPDIPEVPQPDEIMPTAMSGVNGLLGSGMGSGLGNGNGAGAGSGGFDENLPLIAQLSKLLFQFPCAADGHCALTDDHNFIVQNPDDQVHTCNLRVRGIVEQNTYHGGIMVKGLFYKGGVADGGTRNIYELKVDDPPQIYYLNPVAEAPGPVVVVINYAMHIDVKNGSKVFLHADSIDSLEEANIAHVLVPDEIPEHPIAVKQPYDGEFIQVDCISIDE